jgi:adenosylcobinamide kinase/adenosylcobinamide-phosphate guanylyltransferase
VITLVLGGARSGKSAVAERLASELGELVTYCATAEVTDDDFAARVARHRERRPSTWRTVETGDVPSTLREHRDGPLLLDSLGTWIARQHDFAVDIPDLVHALDGRTGPTVIVSEEAGLGVHPETPAGRRWRDVLGGVNQAVAAASNTVLFVVAGRVVEL